MISYRYIYIYVVKMLYARASRIVSSDGWVSLVYIVSTFMYVSLCIKGFNENKNTKEQ